MTARARGMTLLEVLVALAVLATGLVALERLLVRSTAGVATDRRLTRTLLAARAVLADAAVAVPPLGHAEGALDGRGPGGAGLRFARDVTATPHPGLRQVRVRVWWEHGTPDACELLEVIRVPAG
jgi:general secretion pathway protein I